MALFLTYFTPTPRNLLLTHFGPILMFSGFGGRLLLRVSKQERTKNLKKQGLEGQGRVTGNATGSHFSGANAGNSFPAKCHRTRQTLLPTLARHPAFRAAQIREQKSALSFPAQSFCETPSGHGRPRLRVMDVRAKKIYFPAL